MRSFSETGRCGPFFYYLCGAEPEASAAGPGSDVFSLLTQISNKWKTSKQSSTPASSVGVAKTGRFLPASTVM
jgi:hypothetical protein